MMSNDEFEEKLLRLPDHIDNPPRFWDKDSIPVSIRQWARLNGQNLKYSRVAYTQVLDRDYIDKDYHVSTIWIGLSVAWEGPPLIFETMVFRDGQPDEMERWSTLQQAKDGHAGMVAELTASLPNSIIMEAEEGQG
jgi:hypothetical protein